MLAIWRWVTLAYCFTNLCFGQDPSEILEKARQTLARVTRNIPKYTCVETIDRKYFAPVTAAEGPLLKADSAAGCPILVTKPTGKTPSLTDRLRLEVTIADGHEIHAWPGATEFDLRSIDEIVDGPISTGGFGTYLIEIFDNPGTHFSYIGQSRANGSAMLEYAYRVELGASHLSVSKVGRITGHAGSFLIDRESLDLVRLRIETDPVPPETGMCQSNSTIEYHRVPIGDGNLVLPTQSDLQILEPGSALSMARTTYSACHEFQAESSLHFGHDPDASSLSKRAVASFDALASGIHFGARTISPISMTESAAGDRVSARVFRTSNNMLLPEGAIVSGRITALRHFPKANRFQIAMSFDTVVIDEVSMPVVAVIDHAPQKPVRAAYGLKTRPADLDITLLGDKAYRGTLIFPGNTKVVKAGFEMAWVTTAP